MKCSVQYGNTCIDFSINRVERKSLAIEVHPNMEVMIIAPMDASLDAIKEKVSKRASWIVKQQTFFQSFLPRTPLREYVSGETHYYLGRRYILKVQESSENEVKLIGGNIVIRIKDSRKDDRDKVKSLLGRWYKNHGERKFRERFNLALKDFKAHNLGSPQLEIKRMKSRWGSCTPTGKIILNPELIKTPVKCIDYVAYHELCHLIHPNHSKTFYDLQAKVNPEWERWKEKLELALI